MARICVVIPTVDERDVLEDVFRCCEAPGVERVVVDGGSSDGTPELAAALGAARVIASDRGRARQLDAGWREATAPIVLFLHADTRLEPGWDTAVESSLEDPGVAGGAFSLRFDSPAWRYRVLEWGVRWRCRLGGAPYGDQALFVRRNVLEQCGGIAHVPIFEDLDLVRSIRRAGRLVELSEPAHTSPRRYERHGVMRTVARNRLAIGAYALRVDREHIARWYRNPSKRASPA